MGSDLRRGPLDVSAHCGHVLCELTCEPTCSLATGRTRGCTPALTERSIAPALIDEARALLAIIDVAAPGDGVRSAAIRLAQIIRREAREDRYLLAHLRTDEPELAPALERLVIRQR